MTKIQIQKIAEAVDNFNSSPWVDLGEEFILKECIQWAKEIGTDAVLEKIRRADINLFHKEEALCGNI